MPHSVAVSTLDFDSNIPGSTPGEAKKASWTHLFLPPRGVSGKLIF